MKWVYQKNYLLEHETQNSWGYLYEHCRFLNWKYYENHCITDLTQLECWHCLLSVELLSMLWKSCLGLGLLSIIWEKHEDLAMLTAILYWPKQVFQARWKQSGQSNATYAPICVISNFELKSSLYQRPECTKETLHSLTENMSRFLWRFFQCHLQKETVRETGLEGYDSSKLKKIAGLSESPISTTE